MRQVAHLRIAPLLRSELHPCVFAWLGMLPAQLLSVLHYPLWMPVVPALRRVRE